MCIKLASAIAYYSFALAASLDSSAEAASVNLPFAANAYLRCSI
jgi:hypothetical protein